MAKILGMKKNRRWGAKNVFIVSFLSPSFSSNRTLQRMLYKSVCVCVLEKEAQSLFNVGPTRE